MKTARWVMGLLLTSAVTIANADLVEGPIRLIVPTAPGAAADLLARDIGAGLSKQLKVSVIVENKPGAGTILGASEVARSKPDGSTLLLTYVDHTYIPWLYPNAPFDARADFTGVAMIGNLPLILLSSPTVPAANSAELVAYAKQHPGKLFFGSAGPGSTLHLAGELFKREYGVDLVHVPYRGGAAARTALMAGEVQVYFGSVATLNETRSSGRVRALGMATAQRHPGLPDLPTIAESTGKPFISSIWYGVLAPKDLPPATAERLNNAITATMADPDFAKRAETLGVTLDPMSPQAFNAHIQSEFVRWGSLIENQKIQTQ